MMSTRGGEGRNGGLGTTRVRSSFPTSAAFDTLSHISDVLQGGDGRKGMLFGHTDLSGAELLDKELSERRAKAVYALLTHDAGAWSELFTGSTDAKGDGHWREKWGPFEVRHMRTALGITGPGGVSLANTNRPFGSDDRAAIESFQRGDYRERPADPAFVPILFGRTGLMRIRSPVGHHCGLRTCPYLNGPRG